MPFFTAADGLKLHFEDQGDGQPLLCLAGLTRNMDDFEPVREYFSNKARIIRMDYRGRGRSDFAQDISTYSIVNEAQDVISLLDHLGIDKAAILGTSRGGLIAMSLAVTHKNRLSGVFLNDIGPEILPDGLRQIASYLGHRPPYSSFEEAVQKLPHDMAPYFSNVSETEWARFSRCLWKQNNGALDLRYDPKLRDAVVTPAFLEPIDLWPLFDALENLPLALLRGQNSTILSASCAQKMRAKRKDMLFTEVPERGHVPFLSEPSALDLIQEFLGLLASKA